MRDRTVRHGVSENNASVEKKTGRRASKEMTPEERRARVKTGGTIAALIAAAAVFVCMIQMEKSILAQYEKGVIYTAAAVIHKGQMITEDNYREYFVEKELDKACIPATALSTPEQLYGMAAVYDIEPGVLLTEGMFESLESIRSGLDDPVIAGFKAEDMYQVAGGVLRAGDRIHIYYVQDQEAVLAWESIYIQQAFDISGKSIEAADRTTAAQRLNIYLDKRDIEDFYTGLASGSLRAVKVCD